MAAVKIKSAERAAAHARAEADEASFHQREQVAQEKQRQERANRRVMNGERERNRQRKLDAQTGREWDVEKNEEIQSASPGRGGGYRRGMHGAVSYDPPRTSESPGVEDDWGGGRHYGNSRGRGPRGGRGGGRGRGRGRGGDFAKTNAADDISLPQTSDDAPSKPSFSTEADFPALPSGTEVAARPESSVPASNNTDPASSVAPAATWAEEMEPSSRPSQPIHEVEKTSGS